MSSMKWTRLLVFLLSLLIIFSLVACDEEEEAAAPLPNVVSEPTSSAELGASEQEPAPVILDESTSFESNDGLVIDFSAVQVMAKGLDPDTGNLFDMTQFVAGKNTLLRVAFAQEVDVEQDGSMYVTVYHNDSEVIQLLPYNQGQSDAAFFTPRNMSDVKNWAPGRYTFAFNYGGSTATRTITLHETRKIKVLAVPVIANYNGRAVSCEGEWQTAIQFTRDTYPLANDGIEYILGNELDLSGNEFDLMTDEGMYNVWESLTALQTPGKDYELILGFVRERQGESRSIQGYTFGSPANIITESDGDMQPTVAHEIAHCYYVGDEYPGGSINNKVNPAPFGMEGSDWDNRDQTTVGMKRAVISAQEFGNDNTGSIVHSGQIPANPTAMRLLNNTGSFMGSGSDDIDDYWITSDIWAQLYKAYALGGVKNEQEPSADDTGGGSAGSGSEGDSAESDSVSDSNGDSGGPVCPQCYTDFETETFGFWMICEDCEIYFQIDPNADSFRCENCGQEIEPTTNNVLCECPECGGEFMLGRVGNQRSSKAAVPSAKLNIEQSDPKEIRVIDITGTMYASGSFRAKPWYAYDGTTTDITVKRSGMYNLVMEDASGEAISTQYFDVSFFTNSNPPKKNDYAPVNISARYPEGVAVIKIMQGTQTLHSVDVSANAPEISFSGIKKDQKFSGKAEIKWSGNDADGDAIYYELWYCPSEDEYINLASDITQTSYAVDFNNLPGTDKGYFYLFATDSVNTSEVASEWINVDYKAPEIITTQATVPEYKLTDEIILDVDVYDAQDGWLYDEGVTWTLKGREYMYGSTLWIYPYELTPGEHTFTLAATNSHGKSASKEFKFRITGDESALPNDWSREDIKLALANGFIAPLRSVNAAITRGQFASLAANLYWELWDERMPAPEYEEGVVTDCGQDDYDQFLSVKLGLMEAPAGKFNPNGNLTEEEAAVILYRVCAIATPEGEDPAETTEMMINACLEAGVMDESGENAYNASANITGRLALVRCNRLYQFLFGDD